MAGLSALALVTFLSLALSTQESTPVFDETEYLNAAYNLIHHGIVSTDGPGGPVAPTAKREPGYPAFIAAVLLTSTDGPGLVGFGTWQFRSNFHNSSYIEINYPKKVQGLIGF